MLITTRLVFLQQIQKVAVSGYCYYTTGTISIARLPDLIKKFERHYQINQTRQQAYLKRQHGQASAKFYCYAADGGHLGQKVFWVLLFTQGRTSAQDNEMLYDLRLKKQRFQYSDYQLIQKPRADGKQRYTFKLSANSVNYYQAELRQAIRNHNLSKLNQIIQHLNLMPGFRELRKQKTQLKKIIQGEAKRHLKAEQRSMILTMTNIYHRQQELEIVKRISVFIQNMAKNNRTVKHQLKVYRGNNRIREQRSQSSEMKAKVNAKKSVEKTNKKSWWKFK